MSEPTLSHDQTALRPRIGHHLSRRAVVGTAAWAAPTIAVVSAAPAFAASGADDLTLTAPLATFTFSQRDTTQAVSATLSQTGFPVVGKTVVFSLSGAPAGTSLASTTGVTNESGVATTRIDFSSTKPAPGAGLTVTATYEDLDAVAVGTYAPNVVVVRVGTGGTTGAAAAVFLDEYAASGAFVATIELPAGSSQPLTQSGGSASEGALALSDDRRYLTLAGYAAAAGTSGVAGKAVGRVVGRISSDGTVDTSTVVTDAYLGTTVRGAASSDGSGFWLVGTASAGGTRYVPFGAATSTLLSTTPANVRTVAIIDGQLYVATATSGTPSPFFGVSTVGTGAPTTAGQTTTVIASTGTGTSPYGFTLLDRSTGVAGRDTMYIADDGVGIRKFSYDGSTWTARGSVAVPAATGARGVTGYVESATGDAVLFATTTSHAIVRVVDRAASAETMASISTQIVSATANHGLRGLAFAPDA